MSTTVQTTFLHDILATPHDESIRLIYADWLEENGDPEWAELIRVQTALSKYPEEFTIADTLINIGIKPPKNSTRPTTKLKKRLVESATFLALRKREKAILSKHNYLTRWGDLSFLGGVNAYIGIPDSSAHCMNLAPQENPGGINIKLRRGFVEYISMPLDKWRRFGARIVQTVPITHAHATTARPLAIHSRCFHWWDQSEMPTEPHDDSDEIPASIFKHIPLGNSPLTHSFREFKSCKEAIAALDCGILTWARKKAGLPPLP